MAPKIITVSQLNRYVKSLLEGATPLSSIYLQGEISNLSIYNRSGHLYFTLKDDQASIKAVMFRGYAEALRFLPENGLQVVAAGTVSLYERDGSYQITITDLIPSGAGALALAYEQLKSRLTAEGLFDPERKKPLPPYPQRIGVITSKTGAALQDILSTLERRYPLATVIVADSKVQGEGAALQLAQRVDQLSAQNACDVIIIGRGGGSIEELWAFNEEVLVRAISRSNIPIISAVGHETDYTLCDFVADLRAPTPTGAAELVAPDIGQMRGALNLAMYSLESTLVDVVAYKEDRLKELSWHLHKNSPIYLLDKNRQKLNTMIELFSNVQIEFWKQHQNTLAQKAALLDSLSPLKVLERGYSITTNADGKIVYDAANVKSGDVILTTVKNGRIKAVVQDTGEE